MENNSDGSQGGSNSSKRFKKDDGEQAEQDDDIELLETRDPSEPDAYPCPICFQPCTSGSDHHVVALKCGHLFGRDCIVRWLRGQRSCPTCKTRSRVNDLRKIYPPYLRMVDTQELDELRKRAEDLSSQLQAARTELLELKAKASSSVTPRTSSSPFLVSLLKELRVTDASSRYHCYQPLSESMVVNVQSHASTPSFLLKYGIRKIPLERENEAAQTMLIHQQQLKGLVVHPADGSLLTIAKDKTLKMSSWMVNRPVLQTEFQYEPWAIDLMSDHSGTLALIGFRDGSMQIRDLRYLDRPVVTVPSSIEHPTPVASLTPVQFSESNGTLHMATLVLHLDSCWVYRFDPPNYQCYKLPIEGKCFSSHYDFQAGYCLISFRPSQKHTQVLQLVQQGSTEMFPNVVNILEGGTDHGHLCRTKIYKNPLDSESVVVCASNGASNGVKIWDFKLAFQQLINTKQINYDFEYLKQGEPFSYPVLSCLGSESLKLYKMG